MMKSLLFRIIAALLLLQAAAAADISGSSLSLDPQPAAIHSVRFDPSYYYDAPVRANRLAEQLARQWREQGVNVVFYKAYDPVHGAKYRTGYQLNEMTDYGRQNLLKYILQACGEQGIQVMAWIPAFQHRAAWQKHPKWRVKNPDGSDYRHMEESYPLCSANPEVRAWWLGFLEDLLSNYPQLAGVDIGEPVVRWQSGYCHCDACQRLQQETGWGDASALGMTKTLLASFAAIHSRGKVACVTSVVSPKPDGSLYTPAEQRGYTGFDLEALLESKDRPDWVSLELMWQQWAALHNDPLHFTPDWVEGAARTVLNQVAGRSRLLAHLELTSFGRHGVDNSQLQRSIESAKRAGLYDIDLYDTHQIERSEAWPTVAAAFAWIPSRRVLVVSDPIGLNDARQVASLLSHFRTDVEVHLLTAERSDSLPSLKNFDNLFYIGVDPKFRPPAKFLQAAAAFQGTVTWVHFGLGHFLDQPGQPDYGLRYLGGATDSTWDRVAFKSARLPRQDPDFNRVVLTDSALCRVHAWLERAGERQPYALQSRNLWYFADLTTAFVREGGSYIVFADLLHDILGQDHRPAHLAMVRIEDVSPLSDIQSLRRMADYLYDESVPFSISLVPFYLDPASNTAASLSDQPEFVAAIRYMVRKGGVIVMHGSTHQYRGESTADYEFWDNMHNEPLFGDSREFVRERIETGLRELAQNGLYPVTWETPHYGASQLAYSVINQYFSSAYERRQTIDLHGSDQLLPWLIYRHTAGGKIIPENLGYIPLSAQQAGPLLEAARHNLALRDGVGSFFFHPFCDLGVLKEIIPAMKKMGYRFTDPRHTSQLVKGVDFRVVTGESRIELPLTSTFLHEFMIDPQGEIQAESYSEAPRSDTLRKAVQVPEGWIYVAAAVAARPEGPAARMVSRLIRQVPRLDALSPDPVLRAADEQPAAAVLLRSQQASPRLLQDQANWEAALGSVGIDIAPIEVTELFTVPTGSRLIIVPAAAAASLTPQQVMLLAHSVQNGADIVLERPSDLSAALGIIDRESRQLVAAAGDEYYPSVSIHWSQSDTLFEFDSEYDYTTYASDAATGKPLIIGGEYGSGHYLYLGTLFDPESSGGYGRFPFLLEMLRYQFGIKPLVRRETLEICFDPGSREEISIEDLIKLWRKNGVRTIHAAGWHSYQDYTYDYGRLIELAHQNAMRVYLWLELPHLSDKFWLDHPEWREKNGLAADADTLGRQWRRPMALNIPACREAVMAELRDLLLAHEWDGIDLAEFHYESAAGPAKPQLFTPMNQVFRDAFSRRHGYDPLLLMDPASSHFWRRSPAGLDSLNQMRAEENVELIRRFVQFFREVEREKKSPLEIIVTTLDAAMAPQTAANLGVDTEAIAAIATRFPFTLMLEEPPEGTAATPQGYLALLARTRALTGQPRAAAVINLSDRPDQPGLVTRQITGLELYRTLVLGEAGGGRYCLNSEASLYEVDNSYLSPALAAASRELFAANSWQIEAAAAVSLQLDPRQHPEVLVDGEIWPAYHRGHLLLPAGSHRIEPLDRLNSLLKNFRAEGRLVALSGELKELQRIMRGMELVYQAETANWIVLSEKPHTILVDGQALKPAMKRGENGWSFALPAGEHRARILMTSRTSQAVKQLSLALSGLIATGGLLFAGVLGLLWMKNKRLRKRSTP